MLGVIRQPSAGLWISSLCLALFLSVVALVYFRGYRRVGRSRPGYLPRWRLYCFLSGLFVLWLALASWLDILSSFLLTAHMVQHMVLMMVVPPLLLAGAPAIPLLRGLPRSLVRDGLGPLFRLQPLRRAGQFVTHPIFAWLAMNVSFLAWHVPAAYELALRSTGWHMGEHACFLTTSYLFWLPVVRPRHTAGAAPRWWLLPYLATADVVNTVLAAFLVFFGRILYPSYASSSLLLGISPMRDQAAAGAVMWVVGSIFYLVPAVSITMRLLSPPQRWTVSSPAQYR